MNKQWIPPPSQKKVNCFLLRRFPNNGLEMKRGLLGTSSYLTEAYKFRRTAGRNTLPTFASGAIQSLCDNAQFFSPVTDLNYEDKFRSHPERNCGTLPHCGKMHPSDRINTSTLSSRKTLTLACGGLGGCVPLRRDPAPASNLQRTLLRALLSPRAQWRTLKSLLSAGLV